MKKRNQYIKIYEQLLRQFHRGEYEINEMLPTEEELASRYHVSRPTVAKALGMLKEEGWIDRRAGYGTFVSKIMQKVQWDVGLLIPRLGETEIFEPICGKIAAFASQEDIKLHWTATATQTDNKQELAMQLCQNCIDQGLDGVFFAPIEGVEKSENVNLQIVNELASAGIQIVLLDRDILPWPRQTTCDLIGIDNVQAGFIVAEHLIEQGCRKIVFASKARPATTSQLRMMGCREAILHAGLKPANMTVCEIDVERPDEAIREIRDVGADGLICANDVTAATLMRALLDAGVSVPEELCVAAFDDVKYASLLSVPLTTYHQPCHEIGMEAARVMHSRLLNPDRPPRRIFLAGELVVRKSSCATSKTLMSRTG